MDPELVSFPGLPVGQLSQFESVLVRNCGSADVHIAEPTSGGNAAGDFILEATPCNSVMLAPGKSCSVTVRFRPMGVGARTATIILPDDSPDAPHIIHLQGTGDTKTQPSALITPETVSFGEQVIGRTSGPRRVVVLSQGKVPLEIGPVTFAGERLPQFVLETKCSNRVLGTKEQCEINVYFRPTDARKFEAEISIPHNAVDAPRSLIIEGVGLAPTGWCCLRGKVFQSKEFICVLQKGRYFQDQTAAEQACTSSPPPLQQTPLQPPTGLEPGTTAQADSQPISCDTLVLHWDSTAAPGGYFVQLKKLPNLAGTATVVFENRVFGNQLKPPSPLEVGTYEWTVASSRTSGERSGSAPLRYFKCNPHIKAPLAHLNWRAIAQRPIQ